MPPLTPGDPWTPSEPPRPATVPQFGRPPWWRRHLGQLVAAVSVAVVAGGTVVALLLVRNDGVVANADPDALISSEAPSSAAPSPSATPTSPAVPPTTTADGKITAQSDNTWQLEVQKGLTLTVTITSTTSFDHGKSATQIKVGDQVEVKGTLAAGVITADSVSVQKATGSSNK